MITWLLILLTLLLSAYFSGMEIAWLSSNKIVVELDKKKGLLYSRFLYPFIDNPSRLIGTLLVGNNIVLVVFSMLTASILNNLIFDLFPASLQTDGVILILQSVLSTIIILIFGEYLPKTIFQNSPNLVLKQLTYPLLLLFWLLYPLVQVFIFASESLLKYVFKVRLSTNRKNAITVIDLDHFIEEFATQTPDKEDEQDEIRIIKNIVDFRNIKLRECLIPRTEITAIDIKASVSELKQLFLSSGHSKIIVFDDNIDNIIGYVHSQDLFKNPGTVSEILRKIQLLTETVPAKKALKQMMEERKSIGAVIDEFGGVSGIITTEDLIEEIIGEIKDEYDTEELLEKQTGENSFLFSARLEISYINEKYHLELPESDEYQTLGGLIIQVHESIPAVKEEIMSGRFKFIIEKAIETRIELVKLIISPEE